MATALQKAAQAIANDSWGSNKTYYGDDGSSIGAKDAWNKVVGGNKNYKQAANSYISSSQQQNKAPAPAPAKSNQNAANQSAAQKQIDAQKAADAAAQQQRQAAEAARSAEAKRVADLQLFNESILGAQQKISAGNQSIQAQFSQQEEDQKRTDEATIEAKPPVQTAASAVGFDIGEAQKAGIAKTGAAPSGAGKGMKPGAGAQQTTPPSSQTGVERNRFALPEMKDIKLGGL
jgi:hypothetical protein